MFWITSFRSDISMLKGGSMQVNINIGRKGRLETDGVHWAHEALHLHQ